MAVRRARAVICATLAILTGAACYGRPDRAVVARPAPDPAGVAGTYCFLSPSRNVRGAAELAERRYWQQQEAKRPGTIRDLQVGWFRGLPLRQVADRSRIDVRLDREARMLELRYTTRDTRMSRAVTHRLEGPLDGELRVDLRSSGGGVPLGIGTRRRWMTLTRGVDGTLTVIEWYREAGLAFLVLPLYETVARTLVLEPASACG